MTSLFRRNASPIAPPRFDDAAPWETSGRFRFATVVIAIAALITSLTQALVVPMLPALPNELGVSGSAVSWLVTVTVVVGAVANPLLGRLGDLFGRKRLLLFTIAAFALGSAICALTSNLGVLLMGRAIQGLSTASIPLGIGLIARIAPASRQATGIALVSAMLGVGGAAGLPMAGVLAAGWGTAGVFWTSAVIGVVIFFATLVLVPDPPSASPQAGVDWIGALLLAVGLTSVLLPISQGATWGWRSPATIMLFAAAAVVLAAFSWFELRRQQPIVDIRLAARRASLLTNLTGLALGAAFFISFLAAMTLLQTPTRIPGGFGHSVIEAGLLMLPGGLSMAIFAPLGARLVSRRGARTALRIACLTVLLGFAVQLSPHGERWQLVLSTVVVSGGIAVAYSAMPALILQTTPPDQAAAASGVNALARNFGSALGSAVFGLFAGSGFTGLYVIGAALALAALVTASALANPTHPIH